MYVTLSDYLWMGAALCALLAFLHLGIRRTRRIPFVFFVVLVAGVAFSYGNFRGSGTVDDASLFQAQSFSGTASVVEARVYHSYQWLLLRVTAIQDSGNSSPNLMVAAKDYSHRTSLEPGTTVQLHGHIMRGPIPSKANSGTQNMEFRGTIQVLAQRSSSLESLPRQWLRQLHSTTKLPDTDVELVGSLLFGDTSQLPRTTKQGFLAAGVLHVLAASGANLILLERFAGIFLTPVWRAIRMPRALRALFQIGLLWGYAGLCGFQVSVVRAAVMSSYHWGAYAANRTSKATGALLFAVVVLMTAAPQTMMDVSAVLSFVATAAVNQLLVPHRSKPSVRRELSAVRLFCREVWHILQTTLLTTLQVELWLFPILVLTFHQLTPYSLLSNALVEPILAVLLPLALTVLLIAQMQDVVPWLAWIQGCLCCVLEPLLDSMLGSIDAMGALPHALMDVEPTLLVWVCYVSVLALCYRTRMIAFWARMRSVNLSQIKRFLYLVMI